MAWSWRRRINLGPARINISKKGFGFSVGTGGLRIGHDAVGRQYTHVSIPGTGIYNRTYYPLASSRRPGVIVLLVVVLAILALLFLSH